MFGFLVWNLFLAWVPLGFALALYDGVRRGASRFRRGAFAALWLLFLPNAPYVLTDFIHLTPGLGAPIWFDALLIAAFAFTSLLLGLVSVALVHAVADRLFGAAWAWAVAFGAIALSSVGIYLGRFWELNSWDALASPHHLLSVLAAAAGTPKLAVATMLLFTAFLSVTYLVLYGLAGARAELELGDRR